MKTVLATVAALVLGASVAMAHPPGKGPGGPHPPGGPGFGGPGFGHGPGHFGHGFGHGHFFRGVWYEYGVGPCWAVTPYGYTWICE